MEIQNYFKLASNSRRTKRETYCGVHLKHFSISPVLHTKKRRYIKKEKYINFFFVCVSQLFPLRHQYTIAPSPTRRTTPLIAKETDEPLDIQSRGGEVGDHKKRTQCLSSLLPEIRFTKGDEKKKRNKKNNQHT